MIPSLYPTVSENFMPNRQDGLLPPEGSIWRGSTMEDVISGHTAGSWSGVDPHVFEDVYDVPLHIYRTFRNKSNWEIKTEAKWIEEGGILFYSIQLDTWAPYAKGAGKDDEIKKFAKGVKAVAPAKVMLPVGYEADLYIPETQTNGKKIRGTTDDYKAMWANFVRIFEEEGADNVVWVMDYSVKIREHFDVAEKLWPENNVVQWLFFNLFQSDVVTKDDGDCAGMFNSIYD